MNYVKKCYIDFIDNFNFSFNYNLMNISVPSLHKMWNIAGFKCFHARNTWNCWLEYCNNVVLVIQLLWSISCSIRYKRIMDP